jgi:hypothetical protein
VCEKNGHYQKYGRKKPVKYNCTTDQKKTLFKQKLLPLSERERENNIFLCSQPLKHLTEKTLAENINRLFMFISLPHPSVWETWEKQQKQKKCFFLSFFLNLIRNQQNLNTNSLSY